jgi:hypothetical protein
MRTYHRRTLRTPPRRRKARHQATRCRSPLPTAPSGAAGRALLCGSARRLAARLPCPLHRSACAASMYEQRRPAFICMRLPAMQLSCTGCLAQAGRQCLGQCIGPATQSAARVRRERRQGFAALPTFKRRRAYCPVARPLYHAVSITRRQAQAHEVGCQRTCRALVHLLPLPALLLDAVLCNLFRGPLAGALNTIRVSAQVPQGMSANRMLPAVQTAAVCGGRAYACTGTVNVAERELVPGVATALQQRML